MKRKISVLLLTLGMVAGGWPAAAQAPAGYHVINLGVIPGAASSSATGINDDGWVAGLVPTWTNKLRVRKGWLWSPSASNATSGSLRTLEPAPGHTVCGAKDVNDGDPAENDAGMIVGWSMGGAQAATFWRYPDYVPTNFNSLDRDPSLAGWWFSNARSVSNPNEAGELFVAGIGRRDGETEDVGVVWRLSPTGDGAYRIAALAVLGGPNTDPNYLNNNGQATGNALPGVGANGMLWDCATGAGVILGTLGGTSAVGYGLNDQGTVVGWSTPTTTSNLGRAFAWTPAVPNGSTGTMVDLGTLGGGVSFAYGINGANQVVGSSYLAGDRVMHACRWTNGGLQDLNGLKTAGTTGLELERAYGINDHGSIYGVANSNQGSRAYLLTPR